MPRSRLRTHQMARSRSGIGRRFGANENVCVSPVPCRLWKYTAMSTAMRMRKSTRPGWSRKLKPMTASTTPMAMPAKKARGNDTMPAMTAAARARTRVLGPSVAMLLAEPVWAAISEIDSVASAPATAHTNSRHPLRADAVEPGQVAVLGRRLHALAERRAGEEPRRGTAATIGTTIRIDELRRR